MTPRIYVGTYAKYNDGNLFGKWLDVDDYQDISDFYDACTELHADEQDPEFMFQDWEDVPDKYISEGSLNADLWGFMSLTEADQHMCMAYWEGVDDNADPGQIEDYFVDSIDCKYETKSSAKRKWFWQYSEETGFFSDWPETAVTYFDEEAWLRGAEIDSFDFCVYNDRFYVFHK